MTVSITDEIADLTLDHLARAAAKQAAPQVRRRPPTSMDFCKKLRLEGPWGTVRHGDIVSRWHPAVAGNEEWFVETSVGYDPGLDSELETRTIRVAEFKTRRSRPSAGRAISRRFITPAPHASPSKRVEGPWMVRRCARTRRHGSRSISEARRLARSSPRSQTSHTRDSKLAGCCSLRAVRGNRGAVGLDPARRRPADRPRTRHPTGDEEVRAPLGRGTRRRDGLTESGQLLDHVEAELQATRESPMPGLRWSALVADSMAQIALVSWIEPDRNHHRATRRRRLH